MLAKGYAPRTINVTISAINRLLYYFDRRDLQTMERAETREPAVDPELSWAEYLRHVPFPKKRTEEKVKKRNKNNIKISNVRLSNN